MAFGFSSGSSPMQVPFLNGGRGRRTCLDKLPDGFLQSTLGAPNLPAFSDSRHSHFEV